MSKILMMARLYWPHGGGVERHVAGLARELIKRGHKIALITEQYDPDLKQKDAHEGVTIWRIPYPALQSKQGVWQWLKKHQSMILAADIIHIHDVFWWYWPQRFTLKRQPPFITFHGYEGSGYPRVGAVVQRKLIEFAASGSICVGDFMRRWYLAHPNEVTYGAAEMKPTPLPRSKTAVFLGRLDADTGILEYVKSMGLAHAPSSLDIYGQGSQAELVKKLIQDTQLPVAAHDWMDDPGKILRRSRYAFVSRYLSILEAMQAKRLVIAHYNNRIKHDYLQCHPAAKKMIMFQTAQELSSKLSDLSPEAETAMIESAYRWAKQQTWDKLTNIYETLWKK